MQDIKNLLCQEKGGSHQQIVSGFRSSPRNKIEKIRSMHNLKRPLNLWVAKSFLNINYITVQIMGYGISYLRLI